MTTIAELQQMSLEELIALREMTNMVIEAFEGTKTEAAHLTFFWDSGVTDSRKHGKPYLAKIIGVLDGKLNREFVQLSTVYGKSSAVQVAGNFTAKEGDIFEARDGNGSWKNESRTFYIVKDGKLDYHSDATSASAKMKMIFHFQNPT